MGQWYPRFNQKGVMIPAGLLAGKAALVAKKREGVDFPMEMTVATFC